MDEYSRLGKTLGIFIQLTVVVVGLAALSAGMVTEGGLAEYPEPFVTDGELETSIVVGENSSTGEALGAANIAGSLAKAVDDPVESVFGGNGETQIWDSDVAVTDTSDRIDEKMEEDHLILVGDEETNRLVSQLVEENKTFSSTELSEGEARIYLVEDGFNGNTALVVTGYSDAETQDAANFLASYEGNIEDFHGDSITLRNGLVQ